jgi:hypothetical protein
MRSVYRYNAFGLNIQTELALPELCPGGGGRREMGKQSDVFIRFSTIDTSISAPTREIGSAGRFIWVTPRGIFMGWEGVGVFQVRKGCEVLVDPAPGVDEALLRLFVLGTTLAMLLHQRREMAVLHASVVALDGWALAFLGPKKVGKSTLAAVLHARGHEMLSDDILAADLRPDGPLALPGFPQIKLWPDVLALLDDDPGYLPRLRPELEKRSKRLAVGFHRAPVRLGGVFVLDVGPKPGIEPLRSWEALQALMPHWYGARFGAGVLRALGLPDHFLQCVELVRKVPVCRLRKPADLGALPEVVHLVETWSAGQ